jgi:hypothetical protein
MRFVLQDAVEKISLPKKASEIFPFVFILSKWTLKFFWMHLLFLEIRFIIFLFDLIRKTRKIKVLEKRLFKLVDGTLLLLDELGMEIVL